MASATNQTQTDIADQNYNQTLNGNTLNQSVEQGTNQITPKNQTTTPQAAGSSSSQSTPVSVTQAQLNQAASSVKSYIATNNQMPNYVTIAGQQVSISQFLQLLAQDLINLNSGKTSSLTVVNVNGASSPTENIKSGNVQKSEYVSLAQSLVSYVNSNGKLPNSLTTSLGNMRFETAVCMFTKVIDFYNTNQRLPNYVAVSKWTGTMQSGSGSSEGGNTTSLTVTQAQLNQAASSVKSYIATNNQMPTSVTIAGQQVSISQFLQLLAQDLLNLNSGKTSSLTIVNVSAAAVPAENIKSGNVQKSEYVSLAQSLVSYVNSNGKLPNSLSTSLGNMRFETAVYLFSKIVDFYNTNQRLPNYVAVSAWTGSGSNDSSLQQYLQPTANCQSDDPTIIALAASLTAGKTTVYDKAVAIFNYVRDNVSYSFYYNSVKGALGTLSSKTANCCDHSHLLIALARAAGIPARYVHGTCTFSDGTFGHVWAQLYVDGQWLTADSISTNNTLGVITNWNTSTYTLNGIYAELPF